MSTLKDVLKVLSELSSDETDVKIRIFIKDNNPSYHIREDMLKSDDNKPNS